MFPNIFHRSQDLCRIGALAVVAAVFAGFSPAPLSAQATSQLVTNRLTQQIDEGARLTLKGTVHPLAIAANDRGPAPDSMPLDRIQVMLKRSSAQESALKQLITDMHTPGSASYHKWLTPTQFGAQFGPSDQDIATVEAWLQSKGFNVTKVNPGKQTLEMSGNVAQFRTAFNTQIRKYSVNGETHYANATDPQIPAALAPVFGGFASLNNFRPKRQSHVLGTATYDPKTGKATPEWTYGNSSGVSFVFTPADFAIQYDVAPAYTAGINGTNQSIAIINDSNINIGFVNQFRTLFGISPANNPPQVIIDGNDPGVDGINNPDGPNDDSGEAYLDVETAGAVAPNATIDLVIGADTALESGLILALERAVYGNVAPVLSMSFGLGCESQLGTSGNQFVNQIWEQAAAQGITAIVSSGDSASAGCDSDSSEFATGGLAVSGLASTPFNVAVGGTDFYYSDFATPTSLTTQLGTYWNATPSQTPSASILGVIPEQPWNNSQYGLNAVSYYTDISGSTATTIGGGSGGVSTVYSKPAWQSGAGVPADTHRDIPDLSLFAANGLNYSYYPVCAADADCQAPTGSNLIQFTGIGGTSASAPAFAGVMALVNQQYGPQGQANFVLYPLAAQFPAAFHDVTNGTNSVPCPFSATASSDSPDCIAAANPITVTDSNGDSFLEGQLGTGTTPGYNATAGYDLATGLGSLDVNTLITDWSKVTFAKSSVTLTSPTAGQTFTHGQSVTFTGTVAESGSNTPTGDVAIETTSTEPGQQGQPFFTLSGGAFNGTTTLLPGGTYNVIANYGGDTHNAANSSTPTSITVSPEASGIFFNVITPGGTLGASGNPTIDYGTQLNLSAEVAPSSKLAALMSCQAAGSTTTCPSFTTPTGTIVFSDGSTALNTAVLNSEGDAEYNAPLSVGSHTLSAKYSSDTSYNASTSSTIAFTVAKDTPALFISAANQTSSGQYLNGQTTVFNIQVENGAIVNNGNPNNNVVFPSPIAPPTGTVTVSGFPSGTSAVSALSPAVDPTYLGGEAVATVTAPANTSAGNYNVTINYSGDSNYSATSASGTISVASPGGTASTTTATVAGGVSPTTNITVTGTVTGQSGKAAPTGGILVYSSGNYINEFGLTAGSSDASTFAFTLDSGTLFQGTNIITLQYTGDNVYAPSAFQLTNPISNPLSDFSLTPQSTIVNVPSSGSTTEVVNLSSTNGFSGAVNLTCLGTGGVECSFDNPAPSLTAGGSAAVNLTVNNNNVATAGTYNVLVTGTDAATGQFIHTVGISAVIDTKTTLPPQLTLTGPSGITIQNPGDSGTGALTLAAQGGLIGSTTFACTVTGSPAGITCAAPATAANGTTSTLTVTTTASAVAGNYTAVVTATQGSVSSSPLSVPIVLNAAAGIGLTSSGPITIATPGATTNNTSTISVTPAGGFTGSVTLSCSVTTSPSGATDAPTCTITSPINVTSATAVTSTLTVSTTAATSAALKRPLDKFLAVGGGIAVAGLLLFTIPARRRSWSTILGVLVFAAMVGLGIGCGGSSNGGGGGGGGGGSTGTTTGAYVVTVTGADVATGKITGSTTVNVTVN